MRPAAFALSAAVLAGAALSSVAPASAGGDVVEGAAGEAPAVHRTVHHHRYYRSTTVWAQDTPVVRYVDPAVSVPVPAAPRIRRGNFHGRYVGGNYAYDGAYQQVLTYTNNRFIESNRITPWVTPDLVDPDNADSVYHSGVPHSRSDAVPEHGGGGIYDRITGLVPAPTTGQFYENRTRDGYVYSYDYETENPACWSSQQVGGQIRRVFTCAGR